MVRIESREYKAYRVLQHWKPTDKVLAAKDLLSRNNKSFPLFNYLYEKTKLLFARVPQRKNGEDPFIHPINVVLALKEANVKDPITLCAGLLHDYVEEEVDLYKEQQGMKKEARWVKELDEYEEKVFEELEDELIIYCENNSLNVSYVKELIAITKLLTRHKRDFYYNSIINIFQHKNQKIKEKAILVKLADRTHNILCIECFDEEGRIYQCFKNLFILNNVKKYVLDEYGKELFEKFPHPTIELLFKRCAKSTYEGFLTISTSAFQKNISSVMSIIQLAFKKFVLEQEGARKVTRPKQREPHPIRLYRGVVRKYDLRLHHEFSKFESIKKKEKEYCTKFFADFTFTSEQIKAIIDYKDAYALKEIIAYLIYLPDYFYCRV